MEGSIIIAGNCSEHIYLFDSLLLTGLKSPALIALSDLTERR